MSLRWKAIWTCDGCGKSAETIADLTRLDSRDPIVPDGWISLDHGPFNSGDALCSEPCRRAAMEKWLKMCAEHNTEHAKKIFGL